MFFFSIFIAFLAILACSAAVWGIGSDSQSSTQDFTYTNAWDQRLASSTGSGGGTSLALGSYGVDATTNFEYWDTGGAEVRQFGEAALSSMENLGKTGFETLDKITNNVIGMLKNTGENYYKVSELTGINNKSLLDAITDLGKTTATGGQSDMNKTILWIVVAGMAGLAAISFFLRR